MDNQEDIIQTIRRNIAERCQEVKLTLQDLDLSTSEKARLDSIMKGTDDVVDLRFLQRVADVLGAEPYVLLTKPK